jgi:hypothetical protein
MSIFNPFSWFAPKEIITPTKVWARRPAPRDMGGGMSANEEMLKGLYHGTFSGLQFASPLAFTPINIPVQMMGLPTPKSDDELTQQRLNEITELMAARIPKLNRTYLLVGTAWRWPRYDSKLQSLVWEEIPDSTISDILIDVATGKATAILTDERIRLQYGENKTQYVQRKRTFTPQLVTVQWIGERPANADDYSARNVSGELPIVFAHDADDNEVRGYSVLSRIIRDLKDYHDADYRISETLTKFIPKQVQEVDDIEEWCKNNLGTGSPEALATYDVNGSDMVINKKDKEGTSYEYLPEGATAALEKMLERKYWKIFEGSGIPEMFWGGLATGNHATAEVQMQEAVTYVEQKRQEITDPYYDLYAGSLRILEVAHGERYKTFEMKWNRLESISADVKSQIFMRFAQSIAALVNVAGVTKAQVHRLWELNFPESDPGDYEDFVMGLGEMVAHKAALGMDYMGAQDFLGTSEGSNPKDNTNMGEE